jgi:hypothetical protein
MHVVCNKARYIFQSPSFATHTRSQVKLILSFSALPLIHNPQTLLLPFFSAHTTPNRTLCLEFAVVLLLQNPVNSSCQFFFPKYYPIQPAPTLKTMATTTGDAQIFEVTDEQRLLTEIPISIPNSDEVDDNAAAAVPEAGTGGEKPDQITVFHSADNFNVKHPLMNKWTLWYTKPPSGKVRDASQYIYGSITFKGIRQLIEKGRALTIGVKC